jgi:hypothetical protein
LPCPAPVNYQTFGPNGSIATAEECAAAGGTFKPVVFGWMTHIDLDD